MPTMLDGWRAERWRGIAAQLAAVFAILFAGLTDAVAQTESVEAAVKATYLYKFTPFIEWPPTVALPPRAPIQICVLDDAFAALVARAISGQTTDSRAFVVTHPESPATLGGCQILFVPGADPVTVQQDLTAVRGKPILTVTDGAAGPHGIINFVLRDGRVRFEIDLGQAARSGIAISSKLLSLAVAVQPAAVTRP